MRTLTPPGAGGTSLTSYTGVALTNLTLWSSGVALGPFTFVGVDVRIRNLSRYGDAGTGGTTGYSNTLVFTVITP